jgi:signal transduction histidine kinase
MYHSYRSRYGIPFGADTMSISLRTRIAMTVVLLIAVVVIITLTVAYHEMAEAMYYAIDQIVLRDAEVVRFEFLESHPDGRDDAETLSEITQALAGPDRIHSPLYRIWVEGESKDLLASKSVSRDHALRDVPFPGQAEEISHQITTITVDGKEYRAVAMSISLADSARIIHAVIAAPCDYAIHEIEEFRGFMLILGGIVIIVAGAIAALLVYGAMRPVGALAGQLRKITHQNLSASQLDYANIPSDLRPFAESVGTMLGRLGKAFDQQKRFTADAAHELRSPLAVAKSTIQSTLLMPENERDYVAMARSELDDLQRMEHLIEQLLLLARLDENTPASEDSIELPSLLTEVVRSFEESRQEAGSLLLKEPIPQVAIRGCREELLRLLSNLIDNALRYGPDGGTVTVTAECGSDQRVRITVHDEGGNIPADVIPHLTERFYRADASRTRATGGTGLGLSIVAEIAKRHGGNVEIQSSPQTGTTVTITLTSR